MENVLSPIQKRLSAHHKSTKKKKGTQQQQQQQPLKVVYITNPIKFKTTASEFKALVQELTGKHADYSPPETGGGWNQPCAAAAAIKPVLEKEDGGSRELEKMERPVEEEEEEGGSDPSVFGSGSDSFYSPRMIEDFQGMVDSNLLDSDVLQNLLREYY